VAGGGCFGSAAWEAQDAWALTASPAPQFGETPLELALSRKDKLVTKDHEEVAKLLREAGAIG